MTNYEKAAKILAVMERISGNRNIVRLEPEDVIKKCGDEMMLDRIYRGMCDNV